jgi:kynureninase
MRVDARASSADRARERALALDTAWDPLLRRELFDLSVPDFEGGRDVAWLSGHVLGPRPLHAGYGDSVAEAARFASEGMAMLTGASPEQVLLVDTIESAIELLTRQLYRRRGPRMRLLALTGVNPAVHSAQRRCAEWTGLEPDKHVAWLHPAWGLRQHDSAGLLDFLDRYGHEYSIVVLDAVDPCTGEPRDAVALTAAAHAAGCLVGWDLSGIIGAATVDLHSWDADFAIWTTDGSLNGGIGSLAGVYVAEVPQALREAAASTAPAWPPAVAGRLAHAVQLYARTDVPGLFRRGARLGSYLRSLLLQQLEAVPSAEVVGSPTDRLCLRTSVALLEANARQIALCLRGDGVLVQAVEPDLLVLSAAPLYCTFDDCWRAAAALTERLTQ